MSRQILRAGDIIKMPYYRAATAIRPAICKTFICVVVCLPDATRRKVPYLRSDQYGIYWFKPYEHEQGGFGYNMVPPATARRLETQYVNQRKASKTA